MTGQQGCATSNDAPQSIDLLQSYDVQQKKDTSVKANASVCDSPKLDRHLAFSLQFTRENPVLCLFPLHLTN
jgi:hypothetical protein